MSDPKLEAWAESLTRTHYPGSTIERPLAVRISNCFGHILNFTRDMASPGTTNFLRDIKLRNIEGWVDEGRRLIINHIPRDANDYNFQRLHDAVIGD